MVRHYKQFSVEQRLEIIKDYRTSDLSALEICKKYGIGTPDTLKMWIHRLGNPNKITTFAAPNQIQSPMKKQTPAEYEAQIASLQKQLKQAQMRAMALETLIEVAENNGLQIRKKSGAKQ